MSVDVLLINAITRKQLPAYIPNGLLWVAAVLREKGFDVRVYDRNADDRDVKDIIKEFKPKIVGVSVLTGKVILDAIYVSKIIKSEMGDTIVVWGGLHPTLFPEHVLSEKFVDYVVMGEGEYPMTELTEHLLQNKRKLEDILNIGYKKEGEHKLNPLRDFIDINELPAPAFDLIDMNKYFLFRPYARKTVVLMTSRGCPYNCVFCYNKKVNKSKWRGMSARKLVDLIKLIKSKYNVNGFLFHDDNFDADAKRLKEFCNILIDERIGIKWEHFSRVNYAEKERLALAKKAGCEHIAYGLESGSERILKLIKKRQTVAQIEKAINLCKEVGISTSCGSIIGYPFETEEDLEETTKLFDRLKPTLVFTTIYNPYPGSDLYDYVVEKGLFAEPPTLEEQGKIYYFENLELNMSSIPNQLLKDIYTKYFVRNLFNEVNDYLRFRNFVGLFVVTKNYLFISGVIKKIINRFAFNY